MADAVRAPTSPIPESMRICGVPIAPAERITSLFAVTADRFAIHRSELHVFLEHLRSCLPVEFAANSTFLKDSFPLVLLVLMTLVTVVWMSTSRFERFKAGLRYAVAELLRVPFPTVF